MTKLARLLDISTICVAASAICVTMYLGFSMFHLGLGMA
jgi:hypothetical protein